MNLSDGIKFQWNISLKMRSLLLMDASYLSCFISAFGTYSVSLTLRYCSNGRTIIILIRKENNVFSFYVSRVVLAGELSYPKMIMDDIKNT